MTLVQIDSQNDEDAIQVIIQSKEYKTLPEPFWWIGATDLGSENCFYWVGSGQPVVYSNYSPGQPDNARRENCIEIRGHYQFMWNDHKCSDLKYFICDENSEKNIENLSFGILNTESFDPRAE